MGCLRSLVASRYRIVPRKRVTRLFGLQSGHRIQTRSLVVVTAVLSVVLGPLVMSGATQPAAADSISPTATGATSGSGADPSWNAAVPDGNRVEAYGRANLANSYGGIFLTNDASHIDVYLTRLDSETEQQMLQALSLPSGEVSFLLTPTTEAEQAAVQGRVTADYPSLRADGIDLVAWTPDVRTGDEDLTVIDPTEAQITSLEQEYGPNVAVDAISPDAAPTLDDRYNDTPPWNGGDFISDGNADCTSGIPVHNPGGAYYMLDASHCYSLGENIYNESAHIPLGTGNYMGFVSNVAGGYGGIDAELIAMSSSDLLYTGWTLNPARSAISGYTGSPAGEQVCDDGAFEGEYCGMVVSSGGCAGFPNGDVFCHLLGATGTNSNDVGEGDSGGPVFTFSGSSLLVVGTITGGYGPEVTCGDWYPQTNRICQPDLYYTDIVYELAQWGLEVN
jgi:hypothetical protein